jgi:hypothetical protein
VDHNFLVMLLIFMRFCYNYKLFFIIVMAFDGLIHLAVAEIEAERRQR